METKEEWWESEDAMKEKIYQEGAFVGTLHSDPPKPEKPFDGSDHYKTNGVEPIDLYRAGDMFQDFALCNIIKYAFRMKDFVNKKDLKKIIHYAELLMEDAGE